MTEIYNLDQIKQTLKILETIQDIQSSKAAYHAFLGKNDSI